MSYGALREHCVEYPNEVSVETMALCNARCTFCPYPTMERKGERMSDELLDKIVTEIISWRRPMFFSPFKVNEPLLDARTIPLCERLNREAPWVTIRLFTNGSALTPAKVEEIGRLKNVVHLWVSLNSHIPEEYERLMGLRFELTAKRLDHLHAQDFPHPVVLSTVGYPNEDFRRYCFDLWPKFESVALKRDAWLGQIEPQAGGVPDAPCARWFELSIAATGESSRCCMDGEAKYGFGNAREKSLYDIYNHADLRSWREGLLSRKTVPVCSTCTYGSVQ